MPIYDFFCQECRKRFTVFCSIAKRDDPRECQKCGSLKTKRLVSRIGRVRSEEEIMEKLADPSSFSGLDENDPKTFARWAKKMAREMGENMDDEIDAMAEEEMGDGGCTDGTCGVPGAGDDYSGDDQL